MSIESISCALEDLFERDLGYESITEEKIIVTVKRNGKDYTYYVQTVERRFRPEIGCLITDENFDDVDFRTDDMQKAIEAAEDYVQEKVKYILTDYTVGNWRFCLVERGEKYYSKYYYIVLQDMNYIPGEYSMKYYGRVYKPLETDKYPDSYLFDTEKDALDLLENSRIEKIDERLILIDEREEEEI